MIVVCLETPGFPGGGAEDGRAAQSAMGDENGAALSSAVGLNADSAVGHRETSEPADARVVEIEGEEGGDEGFNRVPQ